MKRLLKSFKTEINPTEEQKARIRKTIALADMFITSTLVTTKPCMIMVKSL